MIIYQKSKPSSAKYRVLNNAKISKLIKIKRTNLEDGLNVDHHVTLASVDAAHLGDASGYNKWTVKGQLQGAVADEAVSADFAVVNSKFVY